MCYQVTAGCPVCQKRYQCPLRIVVFFQPDILIPEVKHIGPIFRPDHGKIPACVFVFRIIDTIQCHINQGEPFFFPHSVRQQFRYLQGKRCRKLIFRQMPESDEKCKVIPHQNVVHIHDFYMDLCGIMVFTIPEQTHCILFKTSVYY